MNINVQAMLDTLPIMGLGMAGIFLVILIIFASVKLLMKVFPEKKNADEK